MILSFKHFVVCY